MGKEIIYPPQTLNSYGTNATIHVWEQCIVRPPLIPINRILFIQVTSMHPKSCVGLESCNIGLTFMRGSLIEASGFLYQPGRLEDAPSLCKYFFVDATLSRTFVCLFFKYPLFKSCTYSDFILERISLFLAGPWWCRRPPSILCPLEQSHYVSRCFLPLFEVPSSKLKIVDG